MNLEDNYEGNPMAAIVKRREAVRLDAKAAGPLLMLGAALLFTLMNVLVKLMRPEYTVFHIGFVRCSGGLLVLLALAGRGANPFRGHNIPLLVTRGCTGLIAFLAVVTAVRLLPVSTAMVLFYSFPAFAAVFAFLIYGERIGGGEIACIGAVIAGVAVLFDFHLAGGLFGQGMAVVGGLFAGFTVTVIRSLREKNGPVVIYLYFCIMGTLATFPMFAMDPIFPGSPLEWAMILGIVATSVTAQLLMNQGFFYCRGWEGAVFMSSEVIFTAVVGILFLNDPASWRFWAGSLLILGSSAALSRLKAKSPE